MGIISFDCVASDSTSLYGLVYGTSNYTFDPLESQYQPYAAVVKSNPNPTNLTDITWTLISSVKTYGLNTLNSYSGGFVCAVNAQGVFTAFSYYGSDEQPQGIRYDPTATKSTAFGQTGPGAWFNMTVDTSYNWQYTTANQGLFYVGSGANMSLVHVYLYSTTVYLGIVNEATKTLDYVGAWTSGSIAAFGLFPSLFGFTYADNTLYIYGQGSTPMVVAFTFTSATATPPANPRLFNATSTSDCSSAYFYYSAALDNAYYLVCAPLLLPDIQNKPTVLYTISDTAMNASAVPPGVVLANSLNYMVYFQSIGGSNNNAPFAFMQWNGAAYTLTLNGTAAGTVQGPANITIPEGLGTNPSPTTTSNTNYSSSSPLSPVIGIIIAVVLIALAALYYCIRKKHKEGARPNVGAKYAGVPTTTGMTGAFTQGFNQTEVIARPGGGTEYIIRPAEAPGLYAPGSLPGGGYAAYVPGSVPGQAYPVPQSAPIDFQNQTQIPVQQLHFASHPRPNFVTSVGDSAADQQPLEVKTGSDTSSSSYNPAWAPKPFIPPTRLFATGSNVGGSSPSSISVASQSPQQRTVQDRGSTYDRSPSMVGATVETDSPAPSSAPSIPNHSKPSPVGSPQQIVNVNVNNPQYRE
ncbi:hypothetical protein EDD21DRAFT_374962 [Dissophora ornata]|nr:hypothetical protein EDD21DRAFT_374962 [Dissophora ornata]